jgi:hypothetical protein
MHKKQTNVTLQTDNGLARIDMRNVDKIKPIIKGAKPISKLIFENGTTLKVFMSVEALAKPYTEAHNSRQGNQSGIMQNIPLCFS